MIVGDIITIDDYEGEWKITDERIVDAVSYYLVEHINDGGEEYPDMILDEDGEIVVEDPIDGLEDIESEEY